jgi:hypothetical protein
MPQALSPFSITRRSQVVLIVAALAAGCGIAPDHSARDYANAVALDASGGSLTLIVGPDTAIVTMTSTLKFPEGDTASGVRSVLVYSRPGDRPGTCLFQAGYAARGSFSIVREQPVLRPCDSVHWAEFRIAGKDIAFVGHLVRTKYKNTPVTIFEIGDHRVPESLHVVY